jgi:hypothetical protein
MATPYPYYESDQSAYPSIQEVSYFIHEGRRMVPELHDDEASGQIYQIDMCFALEFEQD